MNEALRASFRPHLEPDAGRMEAAALWMLRSFVMNEHTYFAQFAGDVTSTQQLADQEAEAREVWDHIGGRCQYFMERLAEEAYMTFMDGEDGFAIMQSLVEEGLAHVRPVTSFSSVFRLSTYGSFVLEVNDPEWL